MKTGGLHLVARWGGGLATGFGVSRAWAVCGCYPFRLVNYSY